MSEENKAPETKPEETKPEEAPKADTPAAEAAKAEAPQAETPVAEAPVAEVPVAEASVAEAPKADAPKADAPKADAPKADAPKADAPKADAPKADAPKADAPKADAPKADAPKTEASEKPEAPAKPAPAPAAAKPAAAAAKKEEDTPPPPPDPRVIRADEELEFLKAKIVAKFGEEVLEAAERKQFRPTFTVKNDRWVDVVGYLKNEPSLAFTYPQLMAGTDYKEYIEVYILLHSFELDRDVSLKVRTPRDNAEVPSLVDLFAGFNWEEREIYDLLGCNFKGHPDMRRIMLPDEWHGHPLRKDYVVLD